MGKALHFRDDFGRHVWKHAMETTWGGEVRRHIYGSLEAKYSHPHVQGALAETEERMLGRKKH